MNFYKTKIHVNKHHVQFNKKNPNSPPKPEITIKVGDRTIAAFEVEVNGAIQTRSVFHDGVAPLSCGATLWLETSDPVYADGILINDRQAQAA